MQPNIHTLVKLTKRYKIYLLKNLSGVKSAKYVVMQC